MRLFFASALPAFCLYLATLSPTVTAEDSGELITAAYTLGIAHPPGYPLWCMLGKLFTYIPFGTVAWRVNLLSAVLGAGAIGVLSLITFRFTRSFCLSLIGALLYAVTGDFWSQCVITEVYTLTILFVLLLIFLVLRYEDTWKRRWLYVAAFVLGLSLTSHSTLGPLAVVFFGWVFVRHLSLWKKPVTLANLLAAFLLGFAVVLYLPIRSSAEPVMNWGNPESLSSAIDHFFRRQYTDTSVPRERTVLGQATLIWRFLDVYAAQFTPVIAALAVIGIFENLRRERSSLILFAILFGMTSYGFIWLLNYPPDRENLYLTRVFFLPAHAVSAIWITMALQAIVEWLSKRFSEVPRPLKLSRAIVGTSIVLLPAIFHFASNDLHDDYLAEDWGRNILESLKPDAIIIPSADHSTFPLIYLQTVEEVRPDVIIADKYGYIEDRAFKDLFRGKNPPRTSPPWNGSPEEKQRYLIQEAGRPVYVTTKMSIPGLDTHEFVTSGLVFEAVRKGTRPKEEEHREIWGRIRFRPGSLERVHGDFSTDLVLSDYHYARGRYAILFKHEVEALHELRMAESHGFGIKEIHNNLGGTIAEAGKPELALPFLMNALAVEPDYDLAIRNTANALFALKRFREGIPYFEKSMEVEPRNPLYHVGKARGLKEMAKYLDAFLAYYRALDIDSRSTDLLKEVQEFAVWAFGKESPQAQLVAERPKRPLPRFQDGEEESPDEPMRRMSSMEGEKMLQILAAQDEQKSNQAAP